MIIVFQQRKTVRTLLPAEFEFLSFIDQDAPMEKVLPQVYDAYETYYKGYTIRKL